MLSLRENLFIVGPTSSGKTSLVLDLCKKYGGEVLSADSRQLYKHFDVGTGKMPVGHACEVQKNDNFWKLNGHKIWMYDVLNPDEIFSAFEFAQKSEQIYLQNPQIKFIAGGTGFYIDALLDPKSSNEVEPDWNLRKELESKTVEELLGLIPEEIKLKINESDIKNKRRLIRKIEISRQSKILKSDQSEVNAFIIVLNRPRESIYKRVDQWVEAIWPALRKEVLHLIDMGYADTAPMKGLVYKTVHEYLINPEMKDEPKQRIKFDLHNYIRRQETWFKKYQNSRYKNVFFVDPENPNFDLEVTRIVELWQKTAKN